MTGKVIIFSAPSGSGKTTIVKHLLSKFPNLGFSISATTRQPRTTQEQHAKDYYFLSNEEFESRKNQGDFIEFEEVYDGTYYGTLKTEIDRLWQEGKHVIFDVDVKGGLSLKKYFKEKALSVFVEVPDTEELKRRLKARKTETEESLLKRVSKAEYEMKFKDDFDQVLLNEKLDIAFQKAELLVETFLSKK